MEYFDKYVSNSVAGSGNQKFFATEENCIRTSRVFYKIFCGGKYNYSLLFSNIIDSTFADGSECRRNVVCDSWEIVGAKLGKAGKYIFGNNFNGETDALAVNGADGFVNIKFGGKTSKFVMPGEFFCTDPIEMELEKGEYLCLQISYRGKSVPYHDETQLPVFTKTPNGWKYSKFTPVASMIGCDRKVKSKIGYIGDSITQGIGVAKNSYKHWNALLSDMLGEENAYWNLGLGYARADDMATQGAWAFKAIQNDTVFVCYGVNDLHRGFSTDEIKNNLTKIVDGLKALGKKVIIQTVPPFNYNEKLTIMWNDINSYILTELSKKADAVFDVVPILGKEDSPQNAKYGGHPDETGCDLWAKALYEKVREII